MAMVCSQTNVVSGTVWSQFGVQVLTEGHEPPVSVKGCLYGLRWVPRWWLPIYAAH